MPCPAGLDVFISYAHEDESLRQALEKHLALLKRRGLICTWHDRRILPGDQWAGEIDTRLETADVVLLLVSADFIASDYCWEVEMGQAMERHKEGQARVVPLIVRPCEWKDAPFGRLQALPKDGKPVVSWALPDEAWLDIARGVRAVIIERAGGDGFPDAKESNDVLEKWFVQISEEHCRLGDHFKRPVELEDLERAWVRLELALPIDMEDFGHSTLEDFLALDPKKHSWVTRRWLVEGDPGSGKTTLLRHLAGRLATSGVRDQIPLFLPLPKVIEPFIVPLDYAATEYGALCGSELSEILDHAGREGRLLVLLDSLDEVPPEHRDRVRRLFSKLRHDWPRSSIVLTSRPIGLGEPPPGFRKLLLQPLDDIQRQRFLEKWFLHRETADPAAEAERASVHFDSERSLRELSHNPLHLTLLTVLWEQGVKAPRRRSELYDAIFDLLLEGRHKDPPVAIPSTADVREVLRFLAFALTDEDRPAEEPERLEQRLREPEAAALRVRLETVWAKNLRAFLEAVHERTYILGPHDGPRAAWRFWHRTFREALTAERLEDIYSEQGEEALLARARRIVGDLGRWAEPFALLAGRLGHADWLVTRLVEKNRPLGLRALATAQGLKEKTLRTILGLTEKLEHRRKVFENIPDQLGDPEACLALLDRLRSTTRNGNDLFFLFGVAEDVENRWPTYARQVRELRDRFYDHIPPPEDPELFRTVDTPQDGWVELWCEIPAGDGWIGEERRYRVTVARRFQLAAVPVTNAQYAAFDPDRADSQRPACPVVRVTWYEVISFCHWLSTQVLGCAGARLPREEEWEYACRAGTGTSYWSGNKEEALAKVGWYLSNSGGRLHRVGEKRANPWGLYDMHGNVWEWTASTWKTGHEAGFTIDPLKEPPDLVSSSGEGRVVRGGGFTISVNGTRAAYRVSWDPRNEFRDQGFRVMLPGSRGT